MISHLFHVHWESYAPSGGLEFDILDYCVYKTHSSLPTLDPVTAANVPAWLQMLDPHHFKTRLNERRYWLYSIPAGRGLCHDVGPFTHRTYGSQQETIQAIRQTLNTSNSSEPITLLDRVQPCRTFTTNFLWSQNGSAFASSKRFAHPSHSSMTHKRELREDS